jgi:hypothetical protein
VTNQNARLFMLVPVVSADIIIGTASNNTTGNATTATSATNDSAGHNISTFYYPTSNPSAFISTVPTTYALKTDTTNAANTVYSNNAAGYLTTVPMTATNQFILTNGNGSGLTNLHGAQVSGAVAMASNSPAGYQLLDTNSALNASLLTGKIPAGVIPVSTLVDIPLSSIALSSGAHFTNSVNSQLGYLDVNHFYMDSAIIVPTNVCSLGFPIPSGYGHLTTTLNLTFLIQTNGGFSVITAYSLVYNNAGRSATDLSAGYITVTNAVSGACFQKVSVPVTWTDDTSIREITETIPYRAVPVYLVKVTCTMSN